MRIWAIVFNPSYTSVISDGPIFLESVSIKRSLDRLHSLSAPILGNDLRANQYIKARNVVEIWTQPNTPATAPAVSATFRGAFIIDKLDFSDDGKLTRSIQATGVMLALKDTLTLPGLVYDDATLENIFNGSDGLAQIAGWTADVEAGIASGTTSVRFDGTNVFKSMLAVTEAQGLHLRHTSTDKVVDVGEFGTGNGYVLVYKEGDTGHHFFEDMPLLIDKITISEDATGEFYNASLVYGAGQGDSRLDLSKSTRSGRTYTTDGNGRIHWWIQDDESIAKYGRIERMVQIKKIAPVGTSEYQQINAANALFDAGYENLQRRKEPLTTYRVTVRNVENAIQPGDKMRVIYKGTVYRDGRHGKVYEYDERDINDDFWVMSVTEQISNDGVQLQLEISNIDRHTQNAAEIIVGMIDMIEVQNIGVQPYPVIYTAGPFQRELDENADIDFSFFITRNALKLVSVTMIVERSPWIFVESLAAGLIIDTNMPAYAFGNINGEQLADPVFDTDDPDTETVFEVDITEVVSRKPGGWRGLNVANIKFAAGSYGDLTVSFVIEVIIGTTREEE